MAVSYKRLWKLLIDRDMKKKDLAEKANLSNYTINKMNKGDNVTTDPLVKICSVLNCTFDDIMEIVRYCSHVRQKNKQNPSPRS